MSMERRLQLLLDQARYDVVSREAEQSGRSVAAVIREAIDFRFPSDQQVRMQAAGEFLAMCREPMAAAPFDVVEGKREYEEWLDEKLTT